MSAFSAHAVMGQEPGRLPTLCMDRIDRFPWAGDSRIIQTAVIDVFGQYDLVRSNLEAFANERIDDLTGVIDKYGAMPIRWKVRSDLSKRRRGRRVPGISGIRKSRRIR